MLARNRTRDYSECNDQYTTGVAPDISPDERKVTIAQLPFLERNNVSGCNSSLGPTPDGPNKLYNQWNERLAHSTNSPIQFARRGRCNRGSGHTALFPVWSSGTIYRSGSILLARTSTPGPWLIPRSIPEYY